MNRLATPFQGVPPIYQTTVDRALRQAHEIADRGLRAKDALHIACAMLAACNYFLTTDDLVVKRMRGFSGIMVMYPTQFIIEVE